MAKTAAMIGLVCVAKLIKEMYEGVYTYAELAEHTGLHRMTVARWCRTFHKEGLCHIASYEKDWRGADKAIVYKWGPGKDAKRAKLSNAERQRRMRERKRTAAMLQVTGGKAAFETESNSKRAKLHVVRVEDAVEA
jgi:transposase